MLTRRRVAAAAVLLSTAFAGTPAIVSSAQAAPDRGDRVSRAAERYGVSESALNARLRTDPSFRLTPSGVALAIDPAPTGKPTPARMAIQAFPLPDTFKLHSKPGSRRTIYLDFNGQTVSNTVWNQDFDGNGPGQPVPDGQLHPALDLGNDGPAFNNNELLQIQDIYQRVAEDYAPFDIDVTTQEPPAASLDRSGAGDQVYGTRALISPSTSAAAAICQSQCGGVAFIGVFDQYAGKGTPADPTPHDGYLPAWVFPQLLTQGNPVKNIAEATTHEVGHNLGLDHDGTNSLGYYAGHNGWAPIMGVGYNQPIAQFALNDYPDANLGGPGPGTAQPDPDDLATINAHGGAFRTDEPGTSVGNAGAVPTGPAYITNRTDVDYFALGTCSGTVTVNANNADVSPNLDIKLDLLDTGGSVIDSDDPVSAFSSIDVASGLDASAQGTSLPSGQYFARVDGVGRGTALNGYTDYGSIGAYRLTVSGCDGAGSTAKPGKPRIGTAKAGRKGGKLTASITWRPPSGSTNPPVSGYVVVVYRENKRGRFLVASTSPLQGPTVGGVTVTTNSKARLKFAVKARNSLGFGGLSSRSNAVRPR